MESKQIEFSPFVGSTKFIKFLSSYFSYFRVQSQHCNAHHQDGAMRMSQIAIKSMNFGT